MASIPTFWWRWKPTHRLNFGDELTPPLVERLTGRRVIWAAPDRCELVGAGSVVQMIVKRRGANQPRIWGSGFIREAAADEQPAELDLLAVRGRSTLGRVSNVSGREIALGDPGLLAPLLVDGKVRKRWTLGLIPHYHDVKSPVVKRLRSLGAGVRVIDVAWTPQEVAREISACDAVLSSSLHGLIFSDALGVPNAHIQLGDRLQGGLYKFHDYYSAYPGGSRYRRYEVPAVGQLRPGDVVDGICAGYMGTTGLGDLQQGLVAALREL